MCMREKITLGGGTEASTWSVNAHRSSQSSAKPTNHFQDNFLISFFVVIRSKKSPFPVLLTSVDYHGLPFKPFHSFHGLSRQFLFHFPHLLHTRPFFTKEKKIGFLFEQRKTRLALRRKGAKKTGNFLTSLVFLSSMQHKARGEYDGGVIAPGLNPPFPGLSQRRSSSQRRHGHVTRDAY